jgi:hypothetical protein
MSLPIIRTGRNHRLDILLQTLLQIYSGFLGIIQMLILFSYKYGSFVLGIGNNRVEDGDDS